MTETKELLNHAVEELRQTASQNLKDQKLSQLLDQKLTAIGITGTQAKNTVENIYQLLDKHTDNLVDLRNTQAVNTDSVSEIRGQVANVGGRTNEFGLTLEQIVNIVSRIEMEQMVSKDELIKTLNDRHALHETHLDGFRQQLASVSEGVTRIDYAVQLASLQSVVNQLGDEVRNYRTQSDSEHAQLLARLDRFDEVVNRLSATATGLYNTNMDIKLRVDELETDVDKLNERVNQLNIMHTQTAPDDIITMFETMAQEQSTPNAEPEVELAEDETVEDQPVEETVETVWEPVEVTPEPVSTPENKSKPKFLGIFGRGGK